MTPLLTPSYHATPGGLFGTPANPLGTTPGTAHINTPANLPTPQYQPTPRQAAGQWPGATPTGGGRTPTGGGRTPTGGARTPGVGSRTPGARTPGARTPGARTPQRNTAQTSQDWAKMAEMWAKRKQMEVTGGRKPRTPRPEPSPREAGTPAGDTPLFDER